MHSTRLLALALAGALVAACQPEAATPTATPLADAAPQADAPANAPPPAMQGRPQMTALHRLVDHYVSAPSPTWGVFEQAVAGVTWRAPRATPTDASSPDARYSRSGTLVLEGFGENDLPNGKTGPDADYERGNEGRSGVTLNGTAEDVTSIAVMKFYPDAEFIGVLGRQFAGARITRIAGDCAPTDSGAPTQGDASRTTFFEVTLPEGRAAFVEASVDPDGGKYTPGSTTYVFYRSKPVERISSMHCKAD